MPCFGFVFQENEQASVPPRKVVILGDTSDPSSIREFARDADVLIHESTLASVAPVSDNHPEKYTRDIVTKKAINRGHSTSEMAGQFAKSVNAQILALNHFSAR